MPEDQAFIKRLKGLDNNVIKLERYRAILKAVDEYGQKHKEYQLDVRYTNTNIRDLRIWGLHPSLPTLRVLVAINAVNKGFHINFLRNENQDQQARDALEEFRLILNNKNGVLKHHVFLPDDHGIYSQELVSEIVNVIF